LREIVLNRQTAEVTSRAEQSASLANRLLFSGDPVGHQLTTCGDPQIANDTPLRLQVCHKTQGGKCDENELFHAFNQLTVHDSTICKGSSSVDLQSNPNTN